MPRGARGVEASRDSRTPVRGHRGGLNQRRPTSIDSEVREEFTVVVVALNDTFRYLSHLRGIMQVKGKSSMEYKAHQPLVLSTACTGGVRGGVQGVARAAKKVDDFTYRRSDCSSCFDTYFPPALRSFRR